ncbi:hypothetical protein KDW41_24820 [Burkholderia vietnamiensis]|nr:hypothetical protein [Burkholderia vietnamiensis]
MRFPSFTPGGPRIGIDDQYGDPAQSESRSVPPVSRTPRREFSACLTQLKPKRRSIAITVQPADDELAVRGCMPVQWGTDGPLANATRKIADFPGRLAGRIGWYGAQRALRDRLDFSMLRPRVQNGATADDATTISVGSRTFTIRTMVLQAADGAPTRIEVVAERAVDKSRSGGLSGFHPVTADLAHDTTVELFEASGGEWRAFGNTPNARAAHWLGREAFAALHHESFTSGIVQIGRREFTEARLLTVPSLEGLSKPLAIERVLGSDQTDDRYCLLNADLSSAETLERAGHADPFEAAIVAQLARRWRGSSGFDPVVSAAIHAFRAGMPARKAIMTAERLIASAAAELGKAGPGAYAAAGASAGRLHRCGWDEEAAYRVALAVVRTAEAIQGVHRDAGAVDRLGAIDAAYKDAADHFSVERDAVRTMVRSTLGPDITAINAAARQLFIEKAPPARIETAAHAAAQRARRSVLEAASRTEKALRAAESAAALARAEVATLLAHQPAEQHAPRPAWSLLSPSWWRTAAGPQAAENHRVTAHDAQLLAAQNRLRDAQLIYEAAQETDRIAQHQASLVRDDDLRRLRIDVAVQALTEAHRAAPDRHVAATVAARAACEAFRADGDGAMALHAAATAHLAALAGATEHDSLAAANLAARSWLAGTRSPAQLLAGRTAYAQVASAGLPDTDTRIARTLAARAAAACLDEHGTDVSTPARMLGATIVNGAPLPLDASPRHEPLYRTIEASPPQRSPVGTLPIFPAHYDAVESEFDPHTATAVKEWKHAKIREVRDPGFHSESRISTTHYIIQVDGETGDYWTNFEWSPNANQLYGEVSIKPHDASATDTAAHAKAVVAYNGVTGKWQSFEQRSADLTAATIDALRTIEAIVTSRDDRLSFTRLPYSGSDSGYMQNLVAQYRQRAEQQIHLFVQGRNPRPRFVENMANLCIDLVGKLEGDRSRKKAIIRHQIDSFVRVASILVGTGLGAARVAGTFS